MIDALTIPHMAHGTAVVGINKLNVRADPTKTATIVGQLAPSELVTVWALSDGWAIVQNVSRPDGVGGGRVHDGRGTDAMTARGPGGIGRWRVTIAGPLSVNVQHNCSTYVK